MPDPAAVECRRFRVSGQVQGVFYRASARDTAVALGITGHAVNLADGSVEVLACGDAAALQRLAAWLAEGPPLAAVSRVEAEPADCAPPTRFTIA